MHDDTAWKPPSDDGEPTVPNLPPRQAASPPPPPPSPWAPGAQQQPAAPASPTPPPMSAGSPPPPTPAPTDPYGQPAAPLAPPVEPVVGPTDPPNNRSKWLVGGAVASVLAVGAAGVFAVSNLTGGTAGGAASPEELGYEFLAAVESEDALGVIDVLLPGERDALGQPFVELVSELQRLEVLDETDLSNIAGFDIELSEEDVDPRPTDVTDIVNVDLRAEIAVTFDGAELPIGDLITDNIPDDALIELRGTRVTQTDDVDFWLTAVQHDGRWYFSLLHSIAELARQELAPGSGIPLEGVPAPGADSPEAAVDQLLAAVEGLDLAAMMGSLDPGEAAALQRYAPLFLDEAQRELDALPFSWEITERSIRVEGDGPDRTAFVDAIEIEGDADGWRFSVGYDGECLRAEADGESFEQCGNVIDDGELDELLADAPDVAELVDVVREALSDMEPYGLELNERDGRWYVSAFDTMSEAMLGVLRALDRDELDAIVAAFEPAIADAGGLLAESFDDLSGGSLGLDPFALEETLAIDDLEALDVETLDDEMVLDLEGDVVEQSDDEVEWFECYDEVDPEAATACFQWYVEIGEISNDEVPVELRFPECGLAGPVWSGELYGLPDEEFIAIAEAARDCFAPLLERGEVSEFELGSEITNLECFEGRNWYNTFDDPEYDERYYACIEAAYAD